MKITMKTELSQFQLIPLRCIILNKRIQIKTLSPTGFQPYTLKNDLFQVAKKFARNLNSNFLKSLEFNFF